MKKMLLAGFALLSIAASVQATVLFYDGFSYADGNIVTNSSGNWTNHSGANGDSIVSGGKYQINQTRTDDINRTFVNSGQYLYASFNVNFSTQPSGVGTYFAHFKDNTVSNFYGRVFAVTNGIVFPGTFRLGVANTSATNVGYVFPVDLATNVDYQVVFQVDTTFFSGATLWINPSASNDTVVVAVDSPLITPTLSSFAFRQSTTEGIMTADNVLVGNSFEEVATNAPSAPSFVIQPQGTTNYSGNNASLSALATGTSVGTLSYQWLKNGANLGGATSNILALNNLSGGDQGSYSLRATSSFGSSTSAVAFVSVNTTATKPLILSQPQSVTNFVGSPASFSVTADGTGPLFYQWQFFGTNLPGATSPTFSIASISAPNAGSYSVTVSNSIGTSNSVIVTLTVLPPVTISITDLRKFQNTTTWLPTNATTLYHVVGTVYTYTNIQTAPNLSFYFADETAGINFFFSGGLNVTTPPKAGDKVDVVGPLGSFNSLLELNLTTANPNHACTILSSNNPMPLAKSFDDFALPTNNLSLMETNIEGALVTMHNIYFTNGGVGNFASGSNVGITNEAGQRFIVRIDSRVTDIIGKPIPPFAYQITGAMGQFLSQAATDRRGGYQIVPTRYADIVTTLPEAPVISAVPAGPNGITISWTNTPGSTYSIVSSTNILGPDSPDPSISGHYYDMVKEGINSVTDTASYTFTNGPGTFFYQVTSP